MTRKNAVKVAIFVVLTVVVVGVYTTVLDVFLARDPAPLQVLPIASERGIAASTLSSTEEGGPAPRPSPTEAGVRLGPKTEAFFDAVSQRLPTSPPPTGPMAESALQRCDLNADGKCDSADLALFQQALGKSRGDAQYNPLADADADGVVTTADQQLLFPVTVPSETAPPTSVPRTR